MDDLTLGVIYAVKHRDHGKKTLTEEAAAFLSKYTETPIQYYTTSEMDRIAKMLFIDYLKTARNPAFEVDRLFHPIGTRNITDAENIFVCLSLTRVKDESGYINGFREFSP